MITVYKPLPCAVCGEDNTIDHVCKTFTQAELKAKQLELIDKILASVWAETGANSLFQVINSLKNQIEKDYE